jgi:hypothetical protein
MIIENTTANVAKIMDKGINAIFKIMRLTAPFGCLILIPNLYPRGFLIFRIGHTKWTGNVAEALEQFRTQTNASACDGTPTHESFGSITMCVA